MTEKTLPELQAEIDRLRLHSNDLLAERKAERASREAAESALAAVTIERDGLITKLDDVTLSQPVLRALEGVVAMQPATGRKLLEDAGIRFAVGKSGIAAAFDGDDEIPLPDLYAHLSKKCETTEGMSTFGWIVRSSGASGCGAVGGGSPGASHPATKPATPAPVQSFGLR